MRNPIQAAIIGIALAALAAPPVFAQQQEGVSEVALTIPTLRHDDAAARPAKEKKPAHEAKHKAATKTTKTAKAEKSDKHPKTRVAKGAVPRSTFDDRAARYFDPLSLTLAPDSRIDPENTQYNQVTGTFTPADKGQIAVLQDTSVMTNDITSASIDQMGKGNNRTIVVPLFSILNKLSDTAPAQE